MWNTFLYAHPYSPSHNSQTRRQQNPAVFPRDLVTDPLEGTPVNLKKKETATEEQQHYPARLSPLSPSAPPHRRPRGGQGREEANNLTEVDASQLPREEASDRLSLRFLDWHHEPPSLRWLHGLALPAFIQFSLAIFVFFLGACSWWDVSSINPPADLRWKDYTPKIPLF